MNTDNNSWPSTSSCKFINPSPRSFSRGGEFESVFFGVNIGLLSFANTAGHTKKTVTTAFLYIGLTVGNIVGPQLYKESEAPYYRTGLTGNLAVLCVLVGTIILQVVWLSTLNRKHNNTRLAIGKSGPNVDYSLVSSSKWAEMRAKQAADRAAAGGEEVYNENAFKDMTDLKNEDFVYSL